MLKAIPVESDQVAAVDPSGLMPGAGIGAGEPLGYLPTRLGDMNMNLNISYLAITTDTEVTANVDISLITQNEGGNILTGYVPIDKDGNAIGQSGVTIGIGVDLGQQSASGLAAMGVSPDLIDTLSPYLGLKGDAAIDALDSNPLRIKTAQANQLNSAVMSSYVQAGSNSIQQYRTPYKFPGPKAGVANGDCGSIVQRG